MYLWIKTEISAFITTHQQSGEQTKPFEKTVKALQITFETTSIPAEGNLYVEGFKKIVIEGQKAYKNSGMSEFVNSKVKNCGDRLNKQLAPWWLQKNT